MDYAQEQTGQTRKQAAEMMTAGNMVEALIGAGVVVLAILAILNVLPIILLSIAVIGAGVGMLFQGSAISGEYSALMSRYDMGDLQHMNLQGTKVEALTGSAGIALGVLSLIGLIPVLLTAISAITLGVGLLISYRSLTRLNKLKIMHSGADEHAQSIARGAVKGASAVHMLVGIGATALGILAVIGVSPMILTMIALLGIGGATLLSGLAVSGEGISAI